MHLTVQAHVFPQRSWDLLELGSKQELQFYLQDARGCSGLILVLFWLWSPPLPAQSPEELLGWLRRALHGGSEARENGTGTDITQHINEGGCPRLFRLPETQHHPFSSAFPREMQNRYPVVGWDSG